ncbi:MAG TPA: hypothetical protein VFW46_14430 [Stellaceae bacterium]|nr:hypothetical protein [Stellaceae bacterium]
MGRLPIVLCSLARISAPRAAAVKRLETLWGRATLAANGLSSPAPDRLARGHRLCHLRADRLYAALIPNLLAEALRPTSPVISGLVLAGLFAVATGTVAATASLGARTGMLGGLALLIPALTLLVATLPESPAPSAIGAASKW